MNFSEINVLPVVSEAFAENTYIVHVNENNECVVIDPGLEPQKIIRQLEKYALKPVALLLTHGHADHIGGVETLKEKYPDAEICIGEAEKEKLTDPEENLSAAFGFPIVSLPPDRLLRHGETLGKAGMEIEVRHAPGHSQGHVLFLLRTEPTMILFSGDVLFRSGVGRTDFPDGNWSHLENSIKTQIFTLPGDTVVYSGHGDSTTVNREMRQLMD